MPYQIVPYKNGFRVRSINGKYLSKQPLSYDNAKSQMTAVSLKEGIYKGGAISRDVSRGIINILTNSHNAVHDLRNFYNSLLPVTQQEIDGEVQVKSRNEFETFGDALGVLNVLEYDYNPKEVRDLKRFILSWFIEEEDTDDEDYYGNGYNCPCRCHYK
jgi:hypothetical protein